MTNPVFEQQARENIPVLARKAGVHVVNGDDYIRCYSSADPAQRLLFWTEVTALDAQRRLMAMIER